MNAVHVIVPDGVDDPSAPSGGNSYDRHICRGLTTIGWSVHERAVPGAWPAPNAAARSALAGVLRATPDGAVVLIDGLIAATVPDVLAPEASRLRLVVLLHMPLGDAWECAALSAAAAIVTTSAWCRSWLLERYPLRADAVHVAEPGVDAAELAPGTTAGGELLCVASVTSDKGHDVLLSALAEVGDLRWRCACIGSVTRDPELVDRLLRWARDAGIEDRVRFAGPRTGADLDAAYAAADALVLATRVESYGMVVSEALARGLPVLGTSAGGLPDALGELADGSRPGLLVPPGDTAAFAAALRCWLTDGDLRNRLRDAARERRAELTGWHVTSSRISGVLAGVAS